MRKKFVSAMVFGSLVLASGSVLVGCSDYDDDIDNLQGQIDAINGVNPVSPADLQNAIAAAKSEYEQKLNEAVSGKADNSAVLALQSKVTELNEALNGKADAATVQGLLNDIKALSAEVNGVKGDLDATKTEIEGTIANLQNEIAKAGTATKEELVSMITEQVGTLNEKIAALSSSVDAAASQAEVDALKARIAELETAKEAMNGDLAAAKSELQGKIDEVIAELAKAATKEEAAALKTELAGLQGKLADLESSKSELQGQIDELNNKLAGAASSDAVDAIKGDLAALQAKVADLESAKSELQGKLNDVIDQLAATAPKGELDGLKNQISTLQSQLAALEAKPHLSEADVRSLIQSELTSELTAYNNRLQEVEDFIDNNASNIAQLTSALATIAQLESDLQDYVARLGLVESGKASQSDLSDLATTVETLKTDLPSIIGKYLSDNEYVTLTQLNQKLSTQLEGYYKKTELYTQSEIDQKLGALATLGEVKSTTLDAVFAELDTEAEGFKTYAEVLADVAELQAKFLEEGDVTVLKSQVDALQDKFNAYVESANAAIQSIVFMPATSDRMVTFKSLVLQRSGQPDLPIISTKEQEIKFRVTPAAAAKKLVENYDLKFLGYKMSRAIGGTGEYIKQVGEDIDVTEDGVVTIKVTTGSANTSITSDQFSSICLQATAKDQVDEEGNPVTGVKKADLTSDYFTLKVGQQAVTSVNVVSPANAGASIEYNAAWNRNYKTGRTFTDQNGQSLADFDMESVGTVMYSINNATQFTMNDGLLTYSKVNEVASIDKTVNVTATYAFNAAPSATWSSTYNTITVVRAITERKYEYTVPSIDWTAAQTINLDMVAVQNASGLASADFLALTTPVQTVVTAGTATASILGSLSGGLRVNIPQYFNMTSASGTKLSWKYQVNELTTFEIVVNLPSTTTFPSVVITRNPNWWVGNSMIVPATEEKNTNNKVTGVKLSSLDYSTKAYSNYATDASTYASQGMLYSIAVTTPMGVSNSGTAVTVDKVTYVGDPISIKATVKLNQNGQSDVKAENEGTIVVPDLSGTWSVTKTAFTAANLVDPINLAEGCTWMSRPIEILDGAAHVMWKAGVAYGNTANADDVFATNALAIYGLTAPVFTEVAGTDPDNLVSVDRSTGKLTFAANANDFVLAQDYVVKVKVTVASKWGALSARGNGNKETELTITIPKRNNN